jgi:hypothetical protein
MTVTGHIPAHMLANEAVKAGYDGIEHANQVLLNFFADHETDTRTLRRFTLVGEKLADFDYSSPAAQEFFKLLREHQTVIDPTFDAFETTYVAEIGVVPPGLRPIAARLPVQVARYFLTGGLDLTGKKELYARSFDKMLKLARALTDAGVPVVAGTDQLAGLSLHRELELFVDGGLTPAETLRDATIVPARAMKVDAKTGSIAQGKLADLVVIDGDPLARISDVTKTEMVFRSGVRFDTNALYATISVTPAPK